MPNRRKRKSIIDELFGGSPFTDMKSFLDKFPESGYSISVVQTPKGTKVRAKIGKNTDVKMLRKQLQQQYPNAEIEIEGGRKEPLIREIATKNLTKEKEKKQRPV